ARPKRTPAPRKSPRTRKTSRIDPYSDGPPNRRAVLLLPQEFRDMPTLRFAQADDTPVILNFIRGLAEYEKLSHECVATEDSLRSTLFGPRPYAEVLLIEEDGAAH